MSGAPRTIMISRVRIRNILSHESTDIEFRPGLTAIVGPNGAGKSTIIDSIVYALFTERRASLRGSRKSDILRRGCSEGEIEVHLSVGGRTYIVRRVVRASGSDDAQLLVVENGRQRAVATGIDRVHAAILELFGVPTADAIRMTIVSRQEELTKLLDMRPAERKEAILKLLGLRDLEKAREVLRPIIRSLEKERGRLDELRRRLSKLEQDERLYRQELEKARRELEEAERDLEKARAEEERASSVRQLFVEYELLRQKAFKLERLSEIERELERLRRALEIEQGIRSVDVSEIRARIRDFIDAKRRIEELRKALSSIDAEIDSVVSELESILGEELPEDVEELVSEVRRRLESIDREIAVLETEQRIVAESRKVIRDSSQCPVCRRPMDEELRRRLEAEMGSRIRSIEERISELRKLRSAIRRAEERIRELHARRIEIESRIEEYVSRFEELKRVVDKLMNGARELCKELRRPPYSELYSPCVSRSGCLETILCCQDMAKSFRGRVMALEEERRRIVSELGAESREEIVRRLEVVRAKLRDVGVDPDTLSLEDVEEMARKVAERARSLEARVNALRQRIRDLEEGLARISTELQSLRTEVRDLEKRVSLLPVLEHIHDRVLGRDGVLARELTKVARRVIENYANMVLRSLGMELSISIAPDFDIVVRTGLGEISIRSVSGGEKTAIATALRMAMAYAVMGRLPGFFILDEPTAHLDAERRVILFDMIKKISQRLPQVIVATHDPEVIERADHVIEIQKIGTKSVVRYASSSA